MSKIYIEAGAHKGQQLKKFYKKHQDFDMHYLFEGNPRMVPSLRKAVAPIPNVRVYTKVVDIGGGWRYMYSDSTFGSRGTSVQKAKAKKTMYKVKSSCIDFDNWLRATVSPSDYLVLVMDIEGHEYELLPKMMHTGTLKWFNELDIEFHNHKMIYNQERDRFHSDLRDYFDALHINRKDLWCLYPKENKPE